MMKKYNINFMKLIVTSKLQCVENVVLQYESSNQPRRKNYLNRFCIEKAFAVFRHGLLYVS